MTHRRPSWFGYSWAWLAGFALSIGLLIWLAVQASLIGFMGAIQPVYGAFAGTLLVLVLVPSVRGRFREGATGDAAGASPRP